MLISSEKHVDVHHYIVTLYSMRTNIHFYVPKFYISISILKTKRRRKRKKKLPPTTKLKFYLINFRLIL